MPCRNVLVTYEMKLDSSREAHHCTIAEALFVIVSTYVAGEQQAYLQNFASQKSYWCHYVE